MQLLGAILYDPSSAASKATSSLLAMTAVDTTNLRLAVTVPSSGKIRIRISCAVTGATTTPTILLGAMIGASVIGRIAPLYCPATANVATQNFTCVADFICTGVSTGAQNIDAAYAVQVVVASTNIKYGGPNNNSGANAWGAFAFEIWDPATEPTNFALLSIDANGRVDISKILGTAISTPATAGVLDVNVKNMNNVAATSVTTISANQGTTQPVNFKGTAGSALIKSDMVDVAGAAVSTSTAQIGVNAVNIGGTAQTGRDIGASVLLAAGQKVDVDTIKTQTVTCAASVTVLASVGTAETSTAQTGDSFAVVKSGGTGDNAAIKTKTDFLPSATAGAANGLFIAGTNAQTTITTSLTTTFTGNVTGSVASVTGAVGSVTGAVGSVAGLTASNLDATISSRLAGATYSSPPTAAANADAVWDEAIADHLGAGSTGLALSSAGAAGDPWSTDIPGAYAPGTAGYILGTNVDGTISSRSTYAGADTSGTTTLLDRLTSSRAGYLDNLSAGAVAQASGVVVTTNNDKTGYSVAGLTAANLDVPISTRLAATDYTAPDNAGITAIGVIVAATLDAPVSSRLSASDYVAPLGAQATADAVWNEQTSAHSTDGSTGKALQSAGASGDPWGTMLPGAYGVGTAGYVLGAGLEQAIGSKMPVRPRLA